MLRLVPRTQQGCGALIRNGLRYSSNATRTTKLDIDKILIANRGEIACRVMLTCQRLGIRTVAVHSDADSHAMHITLADEVYNIGKEPKASYLDGDNIIAVAKRAGAQAIHPGYGFLSENEHFAAAVEKAGLIFIGPPASAIHDMGSKSASKNIMTSAGVPCVPGYHGEDQSLEVLTREADKIGYPVMIKAVLGGGGKGMRIVHEKAQLASAIESARTEAMKSFKDDNVLLEKYVTNPRHIEFQVFADNHGNVVYLFERDCSVQRRHQKIIEEAPAPHLTDAMRKEMGKAACDAARAVGYRGAGTVEFILDGDTGKFYFMEMNTRLQVEHPVTEMITKQDLGATFLIGSQMQIKVAQGERLPLLQNDLKIHGHAFEARIYAEDPDNNFLPGTGKLEYLDPPTRLPNSEGHIRVDTGVRRHDEVSIFYDPMISKLIVWDDDRHTALRRMELALESYNIAGLTTNIPFLLRLCRHTEFKLGNVHTNFIPRHGAELVLRAPLAVPAEAVALTRLAQLLWDRATVESYQADSGDAFSPWNRHDASRLNLTQTSTLAFTVADQTYSVDVAFKPNGYAMKVSDGTSTTEFANVSGRIDDGKLEAMIDGQNFRAVVVQTSNRNIQVHFRGIQHILTPPSIDVAAKSKEKGSLLSPMPGEVAKVVVKEGDKVEQGQVILVLEAMKMLMEIKAPKAGVVKHIQYKQGQLVPEKGETLATIE